MTAQTLDMGELTQHWVDAQPSVSFWRKASGKCRTVMAVIASFTLVIAGILTLVVIWLQNTDRFVESWFGLGLVALWVAFWHMKANTYTFKS